MKKNTVYKTLFLFVLALTSISCETVLDCITDKKPSLIYKELYTGSTYIAYNENITFEIKKGNTEEYIISSASIDGNLPPGINYSVVDNSKVNFKGIPNKSGTYEFTVTIYVRRYINNEEDEDNLCDRGASQKYKIVIR
ncbi:hypothetical protein [Flavobacterium sp.]|uniref:hypothetical protein n=1 Tax=Flavobacterium sp. TaxID=239 RepID=UPI0031D89922